MESREEFDSSLHCVPADWSQLHATARQFLEDLNLSTVHPRCNDAGIFSGDEFYVPKLESLPEELFYEQTMGTANKLITIWYQVAPPLCAMSELWLRLFAFVLAPAIALYFVTVELRGSAGTTSNAKTSAKSKTDVDLDKKQEWRHWIFLVVGLASSLVLTTDTFYVHNYGGRQHGASFFLLIAALTIRRGYKFQFYNRHVFVSLVGITVLTAYLIAHSEKVGDGPYDHPGIDVPTIQPGFYYSRNNALMMKVAEIWPEHKRTYDENNGTPYLPTGDARTGIPFLINSSQKQIYHRVWVQNKVDHEAVALDIKFPSSGVHSTNKPIFFILHGLNGGSHEEYVREFVGRRTVEGHTCIVMVARGLMDTPVVGWNVFHGARITDVEVSAEAVSKAKGPNQLLAGVGYSMGAIIISNYVARSGSGCHLDAAMAVSGGLDLREMLKSTRSARLWQPMLAQTLRDEFIITKFDNRFRHRLSKEEYLKLMRSYSVSEIDKYAIVAYNGFDDLVHYYSSMSVMGDIELLESTNSSLAPDLNAGRIANVSIPLCILHALDDPLTVWRTVGNPEIVVNTGSGFIMMVLTKSGGHVGWPLGLNPRSHGWKFMNDAASSFANSVDEAKNGETR
mmetsp:Transcript_2561/g.3653  ORF Transcript_2561/g.3653 Transcript_2561/m.3653 type:complete len:622 (+) Transcript_2561:40-1905(+)